MNARLPRANGAAVMALAVTLMASASPGPSAFLAAASAMSPLPVALWLNDDAGSGGDAADVAALATPAEFPFSGQLRPPADPIDWYALEVTSGQSIRLGFDSTFDELGLEIRRPNQQLYDIMYAHQDDRVVFLDETGTWLLKIWALPFPAIPMHISYTVRGEAVQRQVRHAIAQEEWVAAEVHWDAPTDLALTGFAVFPANLTSPLQGLFVYQWSILSRLDGQLRWDNRTAWLGITGTSAGHWIALAPAASQPIEIPWESSMDLTATGTEQWASISFDAGESIMGVLKVLALRTDPAIAVRLDVSATIPFYSEVREGGDLVRWTEADEGGQQVLVPGVSVSGESEFALDIPTGSVFVGDFQFLPSGGWVRSPSGAMYAANQGYLMLVRPEAGTWTFHVDPSIAYGTDATHQILVGAFVPFGFAQCVDRECE